jgi:hypothetical protein
MDRKNFLNKSLTGLTSCALLPVLSFAEIRSIDEDPEKCRDEKKFIENWLSDIMESMERELDVETRIRIIEGCGRSCFNRHQFKKDIALKGEGNLDKLIEAYDQNFEIWKEGNKIHIRYGEISKGCYCPAAKYRAPVAGDLHCECTKATHQAIFETALGKKFNIDILESVRRGGKTCHFLVHLD